MAMLKGMPRHRSAPIAAILAFSAVVALSCPRGDAPPGASIEPSELAARISSAEAPIILDVRSPEEFSSGHIPGAVNIPLDELAERLVALGLPSTDEVVVHCERGHRAQAA